MRLPKNSILMFGVPRCGSTWASEALTAAVDGRLVNEPFNFILDGSWREYLYRYIPEGGSAPEMDEHLEKKVKAERWRIGRAQAILHYNKPFVIKELHPVFTAGYLWGRYRPHVLVQLRHPCGVAQSYERLGWPAPSDFVREILEQGVMVKEYLGDLASHLVPQEDYFSAMGLWWGVTYQVLVGIADRHPQWQVVTHEKLCADPVRGFGDLMAGWGMAMSAKGHAFLSEYDRDPDEGESTFRPARQSSLEPDKWKKSMTKDQIDAVVGAAKLFPVFDRFYGVGS